jgi:hypothetical protein
MQEKMNEHLVLIDSLSTQLITLQNSVPARQVMQNSVLLSRSCHLARASLFFCRSRLIAIQGLGKSKQWMLDKRVCLLLDDWDKIVSLEGIGFGTKMRGNKAQGKKAKKVPLTPEQRAWVMQRSDMLMRWYKAELYDPLVTWGKCEQKNKIQMCMEAHDVLGWGFLLFDQR